ncbi:MULTISPECIES: hypothetical protein [Pseudomonas]|uniref:hypothetical protein n=1 Tax=Pseudomonas TaxID=286 RepID=UPI001F1A87EC|nr:hypothetical protein [Pseudomonas sputi]
MSVSTGVVVFGDVQVRQFRARRLTGSDPDGLSAAQPTMALTSENGEIREKEWNGSTWSCVDSMVQYLVIVLIGENASWRFSRATF